eukprot:SAG11_NODE_552_length_8583_cov_3.699081_11_plen_91_part_00
MIQVDKAKPWCEVQHIIYEKLGVDKLHAEEDCRIIRLQPNWYTKHMHGCGSPADVVSDFETPLADVKDVVNQIVTVQTRIPEAQWPDAST